MPTCWYPAGMNRCSPSHATTSPAPDRRRGRHCRSARWQRRADSARPRASLRALTVRGPLARSLVLAFVELLEEVLETVRNSFLNDVVKVGLERLAELALDVPSKPSTSFPGLNLVLHHRLLPQRPLFSRPGRPLVLHSSVSAIVL